MSGIKAATILVHLDPHNPASGKPLPEDKSLWPAAGKSWHTLSVTLG